MNSSTREKQAYETGKQDGFSKGEQVEGMGLPQGSSLVGAKERGIKREREREHYIDGFVEGFYDQKLGPMRRGRA